MQIVNTQKNKSQHGQTLIEMVVALGLAIIIVGAIASLTVNGLRNASQSQNQTVATKLAQQVIDQVKSIANKNCPVTNVTTKNFWDTTFDGSTDYTLSGSCGLTTVGGGPTPMPSPFIPYTTHVWISDIAGYGSPSTLKEIKVHIVWTDTTGDHYAELVTDVNLN